MSRDLFDRRPLPAPVLTASERDLFEERAAICEFHGGLSRVAAERVAFDEVMRGRKGAR